MQPLPLLHEATLLRLYNQKNLLAFSGGGDSTALFFLLLEHNIPFDIVHVNYKTRLQSDQEEAYAKQLAITYNKEIFIFTCKIDSSNFEHEARKARYTFFEEIMKVHHYTTLLTAHHLNDKLEWFLMQLTKGAGVVEMLGMQEIEARETHTLIRPLLHLSKKKLLSYLEERKILYFEDESNHSHKHLRNQFRHSHATPLIELYEEGIARSFDYLKEDSQRLTRDPLLRIKDLFLLEQFEDDLLCIRQIDKALKLLGKLASKSEKEEILRTRDCVVGGKFAICFVDQKIIVAPFIQATMEKKFKEMCRIAHIPSKIRPYLFVEKIAPNEVLHSHHTL